MSDPTPEKPDELKDLQDAINAANIRENTLKDQLNVAKGEIDWLVEQYNILLNASFSEVFDVATHIKNQGLDDLLRKRDKEAQEARDKSARQ